ncbi:oxidoreductase [Virgisporangium aliadipatigenens]|uniref:Oxidoreductase n=1 Tax=Virgisporangium aliadipatigenens TaxID=741659 RepID=A0A8J3YI45_9ACTN|nr:aldo/keto reductase [Virgisporangium aliadipatigenens]GIJ44385.1 oxidoreductase [Virgisporangium aliadipatigenens]
MRTRPGPHGLALTELGLGTGPLGNLYEAITEARAAETVAAAWDAGIRHFDTAPHYGIGLAERRLGRWLAGVPREEYVLSTKAGRILEPNPERDPGPDPGGFVVPATHVRRYDLSRDGIRRSLEESLQRLGVDRVDVLYLHDPDGREDEALRTAFPAMVELRREGTVRAIGAGMNHVGPLARFIRESDLDVILSAGRLTLLDRGAEPELLPLARERGVSVVIGGAYNSGILATPRPRPDARFGYRPADDAVLRRASALADVCEQAGVDLPTAALGFPLAHPEVASVLVGARSPAEVREAVDRWSTPVPPDLYARLAPS